MNTKAKATQGQKTWTLSISRRLVCFIHGLRLTWLHSAELEGSGVTSFLLQYHVTASKYSYSSLLSASCPCSLAVMSGVLFVFAGVKRGANGTKRQNQDRKRRLETICWPWHGECVRLEKAVCVTVREKDRDIQPSEEIYLKGRP